MSNRRKSRAKRPEMVAGIAGAARCSDCGARATAKRKLGEWQVTLHHSPTCPALHGLTKDTLHKDAADAVRAVSNALAYRRDGEATGVVVSASGLVTDTRTVKRDAPT
jgi:hypothetical protein